ncbi:MAG: 16S rRNA (cytidine(1402)-2'-O)-methyltransferase [Hydrotalea flava]|uniref:16S rRNA (cytidine(1402)-2'-O)-methyltransferase n=1 Tax=Hydrotalea TaxID=1004300 RepID=UPI0009448619|nr:MULTISPECIES: 16S rRNA (cytidine(1402)-2'-O)-methyltransferase [Hydrotalea]MBY0348966.1 16S rRNA (cytidine(1402)-2'-O)-methyltransferase [Hydrotalea flava]RWZ87955.1 MAG: 16S rRNA (cytidine(1402)-2'-O)-methyltransferase [Hydrotalea sp. AMD]
MDAEQQLQRTNQSVRLYLVPTPVGNLKDFTYRSVEVLQQADVILCEDTRTSSRLLQHYGIQKPVSPYHQHNEHKIVDHLVTQMLSGKVFALITDAGTPGISDPAFLLVRACVQQQIHVECLPGATAFVPALVVSGLPTNRFVFEGFLPPKKGRHTLLSKLALEERTIILYESPMRLQKTLLELITYFGAERQCSVSREISKMFETHVRGTLQQVHDCFQQQVVKGEIVIVIGGIS